MGEFMLINHLNIKAAMVAGLATLSPSAFADEIEAILAQGDLGYGEYLAGECVTCHHAKGEDKGIPSITGLEADSFVYLLKAYKDKELENEVMQLVAGRLDEEQMASLALYFASLPAK